MEKSKLKSIGLILVNNRPTSKLTPKIAGMGIGLPDKVLTNHDFEKIVDTSDEWITARTGIKERRVLEENENPSSLAVSSSRQAIDRSPVSDSDLDLVIVATNVSDMPIPGSAPFVADHLKTESDIPFFDLKAGCSGFLYSLDVAYNLIRSNNYQNILVIGLEALSRVVNWRDRSTCILFGDAAGAAVISNSGATGTILASAIYGDPTKSDLITVKGGGTRFPAANGKKEDNSYYIEIKGKGVFKSAVNMMKDASVKVLAQAGLKLKDIDWIVPHQANIRIIKQLAKSLDVKMNKVVVNVDKYANTSTATIPVALDEAVRGHSIQTGDVVLLVAFGAGAAYGATVLKW